RVAQSPDASIYAVLEEALGAEAVLGASLVVTGGGEDFTAFVSPITTASAADLTVVALNPVVVGAAAVPAGNVAIIEQEDARFRGVQGATELLAEVALSFGDNAAR